MNSTQAPAVAKFPPTLWSMVLKAGREGSVQSREALAELCDAYWYPLYAFLRRQGKSLHDAEDLTQGFFLHLFERNGLDKVRPEKGRFRSFLLAALKHFQADEWEKSRAQKRGGGASFVSFEITSAEDRYRSESVEYSDPEKLFERRWAMTLLDRVLGRLEAEFASAGRKDRFDQLHGFLSGDRENVTYGEAAKRLGMTEGAVKIAVLRLRQRYRELLLTEVANTVASEKEVEEEMRHLFAVLSA
jgi:RNA polymerase sigma-70 factor (ECF subfamily)